MGEPKNRPYPTYSGTDPYAFLSYAHGDADRVLPVIGALGDDRFRLWYDAGIEAGTNWPEVVASHLLHAEAVVFFLSARFLRSQNCIREVHYAVAERKAMICVYLEPVELPGDLAMQFSTAAVVHGEGSQGQRIARETEAVLGSAFVGDGVTGYGSVRVDRPKRNVWRGISIAFAFLFLLIVLFVVGCLAGWFPFPGAKTVTVDAAAGDGAESVEITAFRDSVSRDILLRAYEGQTLYLCGNTMVSDPSLIRYVGGTWRVGTSEVQTGRPDVLELVTKKDSVTYLALVNEDIESFDALSAMPQLVYLDISGNPVRDLSFLQSLPDLKILKLIGVDATDYAVLQNLPALETVYVEYASLDAVLHALGDRDVDVIVKR